MAGRIRTIFNDFTSGELSPKIGGRMDTAKFYSGCEKLENFLIQLQGGITRRPGTRYIAEALGPGRLIRFEFSTTQAYALEFGNLKMRVIKNGALVGAPYELTTPYTTADLFDIQFAQTGDVMYLVHPSYAPRKLSRLADDNWRLATTSFKPPGTHGFDQDPQGGTLTLSGTTGMGITATASGTPFLAGDVGKLIIHETGAAFITAVTASNTATADVLDDFATVGPFPAGTWFLRGSPSSWGAYGIISGTQWYDGQQFATGTTIDLYAFANDPVDNLGQPAAVNAPAQVDSFHNQDVGRYVLASGAVGQIVSLSSPSHALVRLLSSITTTRPNLQGGLGAAPNAPGVWSIEDNAWTAAHGWPSAVTFHQDRLFLASTADQPQTVWGSVVGDYDNFATGSQDDDAIDVTLNSGSFDRIRWMAGGRDLLIGTLSSEVRITGGNEIAIKPNSIDVRKQSSYGSANLRPLQIGNAWLVVQRQKRKIRALAFEFSADAYVARDLTIWAEHITEGGLKDWAYQQERLPVLWAVLDNGKLIGMTYEQINDIYGWHRHPTASTGDTDGLFKTVVTVPNVTDLTDDVLVIVQRVINGATKYFLEILAPGLNVDAAIRYSGVPVSSVSGLGYLQGRTVEANASGAVQPPRVVPAGGTYALQAGFTSGLVDVGLPFVSEMRTVRPDIRSAGSTIAGLKKKWVKVFVRVLDTVGLLVNGRRIEFRDASMAMDQGVPVQSEDEVTPTLGIDRDARLTITQNQPLPASILAVYGYLETGEID